MPISETQEYLVEVGDGHKIKSKGVCRGVRMRMQGMGILHDFFLFNVGAADVVLGLDWLTLGS